MGLRKSYAQHSYRVQAFNNYMFKIKNFELIFFAIFLLSKKNPFKFFVIANLPLALGQ